jgi:F0F1-type ATP synthase epsilon subunit
MAEAGRALDFRVLVPDELALRVTALSIRVPTESGQVGLRPGVEPVVLAVEAGIVLVRTAATTSFVGTAGGLLRTDGIVVTLLTPLAIGGDDAATLLTELRRRLGEPSSEMEARTMLGRLEERILDELRRETTRTGPGRSGSPAR